MTSFKSIMQAFILSTMTLSVVSCVPKAVEKKAVCGSNQVFNAKTKACNAVTNLRAKPVGTLSSATLTEETPSTVTLSYTDTNKDNALYCKVSSISTNIEIMSPQLLSGGLFTQATTTATVVNNLATSIPAPDDVAALAASAAMTAALDAAKLTFNPTSIYTYMGTYRTQITAILTLAANYPANLTVKNFYTLAQTSLLDLDPKLTMMTNRCDCSGGVCTTTIIPKTHQTGSAGFSYTITDVDGEGTAKGVSVGITALAATTAHLRPVAGSGYISVNESNTSTASSYAVTLPGASDLNSTLLANYRYYFNGTKDGSSRGVTAFGKVTACMDLTGSSGLTDTSCIYTPDDGDAFDANVVAPAAEVTIGDLVFTALTYGTVANNITIQYFNIQNDNSATDTYVTKTETYGLISTTYNESFVRVAGNAIKVFINPNITTSNNIRDLLNAHPLASQLITVTGGSGAFPIPAVLTPAAVNLVGGLDGFDTIPFTVNNLLSSSANSSSVMVKMNAVNDLPMVPKTYISLFSQTETFLEEETRTLTLGYKDVDSYLTNVTLDVKVDTATPTCSTIMTNAAFNLMTTSTYFNLTVPAAAPGVCAVDGTCTIDLPVEANLDFAGSACLYYTITDLSGDVSSVQSVNIVVTPINDVPLLSSVALPTITALADTNVNEDLAPALASYTDIYAGPGGDVFEASQLLTVTAVSSLTTLVPNVSCQNYTPGAGTPIGSIVPTVVGSYFFDTVNYRCYISTGTTTSSDWALHPSLTAYPNCSYDYYGQGTPVGVVTPSAAGKHYLDVTNNRCYISSSTLSSSWAQDTTLSNYKISYVPVKDQSGITNIAVTVTDDGGVTNGGVNTVSDTFQLTVNFINDAPYYISTITSIETNEGGAVQSDAFSIDEDEGSTANEDTQASSISAIVTDNAGVLPVSAITIFYDLNDNGVEDSGESRAVGATLENAAADDVKDHNFYLKLDPVDGVSGNANVTLTISDGLLTTDTTFSFVVHPIAALHGGWTNISSVGIKTDKKNAPIAESDIACNYNLVTDSKACSGASCTGTASPHSLITPDAANVIYWDSSNKSCYRSTSTSKFSWVELKTSCPITRSTGVCSSNNCIISATPVGSTTPTATGEYVYDSTAGACYVSTGTTNTDWEVYVPSKVTLEWKSFIIAGSGPHSGVQINGWNVYRRESNMDYNFKGGHLKNASSTTTYTITDPSIKKFVDTTAVAGKVYYYVVRPVDSHRLFPTYTPEVFSEVRVLASPANYSFVHRWMVNQEICNGMNITNTTTPYTIDQTKNFRCPYKGPGESTDAVGYYDYGKDLLVDTQELGCPYAAAPKCSSNGCVGLVAPVATAGIATDDLYYDRGAGICYRYNGATWDTFDTVFAVTNALATSLNTALNAPLANITQTKAAAVCSARLVPTGTEVTFTATTASLPSKKDYNAYASHPTSIADADVTILEQGYSLNIASRCNGSSASGLETAFTDSSVPSTSFIYSLPGSFSSGIRSLYTGSIPWGSNKSTEDCVSRFGIQDLYGNVAEWTSDQMICAANICTPGVGTSFGDYDFDTTDYYGFDYKSGPYNDADGSGDTTGVDAYLTSWIYEDELFNAGKFSYPVGLPINADVAVAYPTSSSLPWLLDIGPSSGITTNKLHKDGMTVNGAVGTRSFAVGGSYLSGDAAGRFSSELISTTDKRSDVGVRCIIPIDSLDDYPADTQHTYPYSY